MKETTLNIKGMTCKHCKMTVENALESHNLVKEAVVDLDDGTATVKYEDSLEDLSELEDLVEEAGYKVV